MPIKDPHARREYYQRYRKTEHGKKLINAGNAKWRAKNPERQRAAQKDWMKRNADKINAIRIKATYGAVPPQPNVCDACAQPWGLRTLRPVIDHDHKTGEFRGWIHHGCNAAFGLMLEDEQRLKLLANYAQKWRLLS